MEIEELVAKLPPDLRQEVIDFIEFLLEKRKQMERKTVNELSAFAGILESLPVEPLEYQEKVRNEWE